MLFSPCMHILAYQGPDSWRVDSTGANSQPPRSYPLGWLVSKTNKSRKQQVLMRMWWRKQGPYEVLVEMYYFPYWLQLYKHSRPNTSRHIAERTERNRKEVFVNLCPQQHDSQRPKVGKSKKQNNPRIHQWMNR